MSRRLRAASVAVVLLALAGCSGAKQAPVVPAPATVTITAPASVSAQPTASARQKSLFATAGDFQCATSTDQLLPGSNPVTVMNVGSGFVTLSLRPSTSTTAESDIYRIADIGPGATAQMTVVLEAGSYTVVCTSVSRAIAAPRPLVVG